MNGFDVDKLVMILSADWFASHWHRLGLDVGEKTKLEIKSGCRKLVQQIMLSMTGRESSAAHYDLTLLSKSRIEKTLYSFINLLKNVHASAVVIENVKIIMDRDEDTRKNAWKFEFIHLSLFSASSDSDIPELEPHLFESLKKIWKDCDQNDVNFDLLSQESKSDWDLYLKRIIQDPPSLLQDFLAAELAVRRSGHVWSQLESRLSTSQRQDLVNWYRLVDPTLSLKRHPFFSRDIDSTN